MKTIIILTVIGLFGGDRFAYSIPVPDLGRCYDMAEIELQRKEVAEAVCTDLKWVE